MGYLIDILIGVASGIVTGEVSAHAKPVAEWLIEKAVRRLALGDRERFREEWLAHLEETPGLLGKIWHVLGCYFCAAELAKMRARCVGRVASSQRIAALVECVEQMARHCKRRGVASARELPPEEFAVIEKTLTARINALTDDDVRQIAIRLSRSQPK